MATKRKRSVLFAGQSYYHTRYLSRELRRLGWKADVLNWDPSQQDQIYYHGEDYKFSYEGRAALLRQLKFYAKSVAKYDIFHFSNAHGMQFGYLIQKFFRRYFGDYSEIELLRHLGKKIAYSINGCLDGASQTSLSRLAPLSPCDICKWRNEPSVCSDERNLAWAKMRNELADYIVATAHSPTDYNLGPHVHQVPEFYCLDSEFWHPDLLIPTNYRLPLSGDTVKVYHSVGNFELRSILYKNIKCTHIYLPLVERLKNEGYKVELIFFANVPNRILRYYQAQADIVVDMLTYGWFGANVREAMMLGKPAVCYLRPEWLEFARKEIPEYVDELPVVSATPETIHDVLCDLINNPEKRKQIGIRSREFAVKWHSAEAAAKRFDQIYSELLE